MNSPAMWWVPAGGFIWKPGADDPPLLPRVSTGTCQSTPYPVPPTLFERFIAIEPSRDGITQFANEFGTLGPDGWDTLSRWLIERSAMKAAVMLFNGELKPKWNPRPLPGRERQGNWVVEWKTEGLKIKQQGAESDAVSYRGTGLVETQGNRTDGAKRLLSKIVTRHLQGQVETRLDLVRRSPSGHGFTLTHSPRSLLGILWLQVAEMIRHGQADMVRCENPRCGKLFATAPGIRRRGSIYCSDACKAQVWRARTGYKRPKPQ